MKSNRQQVHIPHKHPSEDPHYGLPESADMGNLGNSVGGQTKYGDQMHGTYKQPWVSHDGIADPTGDNKIG